MHGRLGIVISVVTVASVLLIASDGAGQPAATEPVELQWRSDLFENTEAFRALFKPDAGLEVPPWEAQLRKRREARRLPGGEERIAQLQEAIQKYPNSPYADDAALLLARAYLLYEDDAQKAIAGLYDVVKKYPKGAWIAEDRVVRDYIAWDLTRRGKEALAFLMRPGAGLKMAGGVDSDDVISYMTYVAEHPNLTADEAKYWIAWIILKLGREQQYQEAEGLLRGVIARYRDAGRTQADLEAGKRLENKLIETMLPRTEQRAHALLIELLKSQGKQASVDEAAEAYARLHKGHESVQGILEDVQTDRIPAWMGDILQHTEAFRALFKPGTTGNSVSEVHQWEGKSSKGGKERIAQLEEALRKYPNSPYADDAALLLARAYFLYGSDLVGTPSRGSGANQRDSAPASFVYGRDAEKAIAGLYDVIKKYPNGAWIAEDPIVLRDIAVLTLEYGKERMAKAIRSDETEYMRNVAAYMEYASEHPNFTSDEAKCWIAWIILKTSNEQRYQEAEDLLRSVITRHRGAARTQTDLKAAKRLANSEITRLVRSECSAYQWLVPLLKRMGKDKAAAEAAAELERSEAARAATRRDLE